ncbi:MAG TPA: four helix bundle protein [Chryseolinea sp.]|nr:four helix bundle protein [Chryseolinea sp.]
MARKYDLEDRLIDFSSKVMNLVETLPSTKSSSYIAKQIIRCGVAPSLLYGEAQSAESKDDFVHKMKIALKELKETRISLKLILRNGMAENIDGLCRENEELIAIFCKSIETAKRNNQIEQ